MQNMTKGNGKMTSGLSYRELLQTYLPRPINTEAEYDSTISKINEFVDKGDLTQDEQDYLTLLGTLVMAYEDEHYPDTNFALRGVDLLRALITEEKLRATDLLPVFKTESNLKAILSGRQLITHEQSQLLAAFFDLPQALFIDALRSEHLPVV